MVYFHGLRICDQGSAIIQCEPAMLARWKFSGDPPGDPPWGVFWGGLRIFWLNHWQIQTKFSIFFFIFEGLKLCIQGRKIFAEIRYLKNLYLQMHNDFDAGHVQDDKEKSPLIRFLIVTEIEI